MSLCGITFAFTVFLSARTKYFAWRSLDQWISIGALIGKPIDTIDKLPKTPAMFRKLDTCNHLVTCITS